MEQLKGYLSGASVLKGKLSAYGGGGGTLPYYTGEYEVDPTFDLQTLATRDKSMSDDVTIKAIAVQTVTNPSGGNTIYIGII